MNIKASLFTGSRVYGRPTETSDVDLVLWTDWPTITALKILASSSTDYGLSGEEEENGKPGSLLSATMRFGNLNVICVTDEKQFECWEQGTEALTRVVAVSGPVTREEAVEVFQSFKRRLL